MNVWAFIGVTLPLVLTPGVSTAVVLRVSVARGTAAGLITAAGLNASSLMYGCLTALGLPAIARRWPTALAVLRYAGGAYLLWLGLRTIARGVRNLRSTPAPIAVLAEDAPAPEGWTKLFAEGFVVNTLNPPIAAFYFLILPQFVPASRSAIGGTLLLTAIHVSMAATWHVAWALAGGALASRLGAGPARASLEVATGLALSLLGLALIL